MQGTWITLSWPKGARRASWCKFAHPKPGALPPGEEGAGILHLAAPACPGSLPAAQWGFGGLMAPSPGEGGQGHLSPVIFFPEFPKELGLKPSPWRGAGSHQHPTTRDKEEAQSSAWVRGCTPTPKSPRKDLPSPSSASTFSPPLRSPQHPQGHGCPRGGRSSSLLGDCNGSVFHRCKLKL